MNNKSLLVAFWFKYGQRLDYLHCNKKIISPHMQPLLLLRDHVTIATAPVTVDQRLH